MDVPTTPVPEQGDPRCAPATAEARASLQRFCARCHGGGASSIPTMPDVLDVDDLIARGLVTPGDAAGSELLERILTGQMPPAAFGLRPASQDIEAVRDWIACGATSLDEVPPEPEVPREFVALDDVMARINSDLRSMSFEARQRHRYIVLAHEWNRGASDEQLERQREAVSFTINSLSQGPSVVVPSAIDDDRLILRVDLDDYEWSSRDWEQLIVDYPYALTYSQGSALETQRRFIADATRTRIPVVLSDWFVNTASSGDRYYELLDLPPTLSELRQQLRLPAVPSSDRVARAGFAESGVSVSNRVIERESLPGGGALWTSYDFATSAGDRNIFAFPTDFNYDGGELIFTLPNGLQGYYIHEVNGTRLDKAPQAIVSDPRMPDRAVVAGLSCMGCHDSTGIIPRADEVRAHALRVGVGGRELQTVMATYPEESVMTSLMRQDGETFLAARTAAGVASDSSEPAVVVALAHDDDVDLRGLAGILFIPHETLLARIVANSSSLPRSIAGLSAENFRTAREEVDLTFSNVACVLRVGVPVCTDATRSSPCGCRGDAEQSHSQ